MSKDWSRIGPVTVIHRYGNTWTYPSLKAAILDNTWGWWEWGEQYAHRISFTTPSGQRSMKFIDGANYVVRDEIVMTVPVWRIAEEVAALGLSPVYATIRHYNRMISLGYRSERHFRKGPVPGIHRWRRYRSLRHPATTQEIRENEFLAYDEEAVEYRIRCRGRRRRHNLPDLYEDQPKNRSGHGWKVNRRTQWRT